MNQEIRLRWTSHQETILTIFDKLLTTETLVDVTLAAEGQFLKAHQVILAASSAFFQDLLSQSTCNDKHPIIFLNDVKYSELKALISYMYKGEATILQDDLPSLLKVAESLKIRGLFTQEKEIVQQQIKHEETIEEEDEEEEVEGESEFFEGDDFEDVCTEPTTKIIEETGEEHQSTSTSTQNNHVHSHYIPYNNIQQNQDDAINTEKESYECPKCGKKYTSNKSLWRHRKFACEGKQSFECSLCGKIFSRSDNLRRHAVVAHCAN